MTFIPAASDFQQLHSGDPHGSVNCSAWSGAWLVSAHSAGKTVVTGAQVRAATDEPKPDPKSPGLTLPQVDAAVRKLTSIDFDTRLGDSIADAQARIVDGRFAEIQVIRGVLIDHGMGGNSGFRGGHAITVHWRDGIPFIGDPLVPWYIRGSWGPIWAAAAAISGAGRVNAMFTRDLAPDYRVSIEPTPPHKVREFHTFTVRAGRITSRGTDVTKGGIERPCTPPQWYPWSGHVGRSLVRIVGGLRDGDYVRSFFAHEVR